MTTSEKIKILENALNKYGISIDDPEVQTFLNFKRNPQPNLEKNGKELKYGPIIPEIQQILPSDFELNSYGTQTSIMEWYLYENSAANPLVWDNLDKDTPWLKGSFEESKHRDGRGVIVDVNGNYFNNGDANHRLLTLMLKHFIEHLGAKTQEEKKAVDEKYTLTVPVSYPHDADLIDAIYSFNNKYDSYYIRTNKNSPLSPIVAGYRQAHSSRYTNYPVSYDRSSDTYTYNFNEQEFKGTASEMTEYLNNKEINATMSWQDDKDNYYRSQDNFVLKSKDKETLKSTFDKTNFHQTSPYVLSIYDLDSNIYSIETESVFWDEIDPDLSNKLSDIVDDFISLRSLKKYKDKGLNLSNMKANFDKDRYFKRVDIPSFSLTNLTRDEYKECYNSLASLLDEIHIAKANYISSKDVDPTEP